VLPFILVLVSIIENKFNASSTLSTRLELTVLLIARVTKIRGILVTEKTIF
jgi:hypothetical protein